MWVLVVITTDRCSADFADKSEGFWMLLKVCTRELIKMTLVTIMESRATQVFEVGGIWVDIEIRL